MKKEEVKKIEEGKEEKTENNFEAIFELILEGALYERLERTIYDLVRVVYITGWMAAGGEKPKSWRESTRRIPFRRYMQVLARRGELPVLDLLEDFIEKEDKPTAEQAQL